VNSCGLLFFDEGSANLSIFQIFSVRFYSNGGMVIIFTYFRLYLGKKFQQSFQHVFTRSQFVSSKT